MNLFFNFLILNDYPEKWQLSFQDPATSIMENLYPICISFFNDLFINDSIIYTICFSFFIKLKNNNIYKFLHTTKDKTTLSSAENSDQQQEEQMSHDNIPFIKFKQETKFEKAISYTIILLIIILRVLGFFNLAAFLCLFFFSFSLFMLFFGPESIRIEYLLKNLKDILNNNELSILKKYRLIVFIWMIIITHCIFFSVWGYAAWTGSLCLFAIYICAPNIEFNTFLLLLITSFSFTGFIFFIQLNLIFWYEKKNNNTFYYKYINKAYVLLLVENSGLGGQTALLLAKAIGVATITGLGYAYSNHITEQHKTIQKKIEIEGKIKQTQINADAKVKIAQINAETQIILAKKK